MGSFRGIIGAIAFGIATVAGARPVLAAGACSGSQQTISFANWASAEAATQKEVSTAIAAFEHANPYITVKVISIPFAETVSNTSRPVR